MQKIGNAENPLKINEFKQISKIVKEQEVNS